MPGKNVNARRAWPFFRLFLLLALAIFRAAVFFNAFLFAPALFEAAVFFADFLGAAGFRARFFAGFALPPETLLDLVDFFTVFFLVTIRAV